MLGALERSATLLAIGSFIACTSEERGEDRAEEPTPFVSSPAIGVPPRGIRLEAPPEHFSISRAVDTLIRPPVEPQQNGIAFAGPGQAPLPIFLNRHGGTYTPGGDDSRTNSTIVPNQQSTVTPYAGSEAEWQQLVACVRDMFAPFNVTVVEQEPSGGEYVEAVIGGTPGQVGLPRGVGGVAPMDRFGCRIIPNAIVFAFSDVYGSDPQATCETAAQEIAHAFSLDHEFYCPDPMTYLNGCGAKTFRDVDARCGEFQARDCDCERPRQNSVRVLTEKLGAATGAPPPPPPTNDRTPPRVGITSPGDEDNLPANSVITVTATATDDVQLSTVELVWSFSQTVFPCPYSGGGGSVECSQSGNVSTWRIRVGEGDRSFRVRARDVAGNLSETADRRIHLGSGQPPPPVPDTSPPIATITTPADGAMLAANTTIRVEATVSDDQGLASVDLIWIFGNDSFPCPFQGQGVSCAQQGNVYTWTLNVGVGTRRFAVRAVDLAGNAVTTPERTITLITGAPPTDPTSDTVAEENDRAADAFPTRCGNAIDLVVSSADEDWFAFEAPANTRVEVGISAVAGARVGLALYRSDGTTMVTSASDVLAAGGSLSAVSMGPNILARVSTPGAAVSYRLSAVCAIEPPNGLPAPPVPPPTRPEDPNPGAELPEGTDSPAQEDPSGGASSSPSSPGGSEPSSLSGDVGGGCACSSAHPGYPAYPGLDLGHLLLAAIVLARASRNRRRRTHPAV